MEGTFIAKKKQASDTLSSSCFRFETRICFRMLDRSHERYLPRFDRKQLHRAFPHPMPCSAALCRPISVVLVISVTLTAEKFRRNPTVDGQPTLRRSTVGNDCWPTVNRQPTDGRPVVDCRLSIDLPSVDCRLNVDRRSVSVGKSTHHPPSLSFHSRFHSDRSSSRHVLLYWRHRDKKLFQNRVLDFSETFCSSIAPKWLGSRVASVSCRSSVGQASVDRQWRSTDNAPIVCRKLSIDYRPTASRARLERWRSVERQPPIRPPVGRHSTPFWTWYGTTDIRRLGVWWSSVGRPWPTVARRTADTRTMLEWQSVDARSKPHNVNTDAWSDN